MGEQELSAAGEARRESMLVELDAAMRRCNTRRRMSRAGLAISPLLIIGALVWGAGGFKSSGQKGTPRETAVAHAEVNGFIVVVATDPLIEQRLTAPERIANVKMIDDAELQALLRSLGRSTGLIKTGGHTVLASDIVVPSEQNRTPEESPDGATS